MANFKMTDSIEDVKLGQNFRTRKYNAGKDMTPSLLLFVKNLNRMIDSTGTFKWDHDEKQTVKITKGIPGKDSSLSLLYTRKGTMITVSGTLKASMESSNGRSSVSLRVDNALPNNFAPFGGIANEIMGADADQLVIEFVHGTVYFITPPSDGVKTYKFRFSYLGGPVLVVPGKKREHIKKTDKFSVEVVNAILAEFKKSSAKIPARPSNSATKTDNYDISQIEGTQSNADDLKNAVIVTASKYTNTLTINPVKLVTGSIGESITIHSDFNPKNKVEVQVTFINKHDDKTDTYPRFATMETNGTLKLKVPTDLAALTEGSANTVTLSGYAII